MTDEKTIKSLEQRLAQLETAISSITGSARTGPFVDPAPWGTGGWGGVQRWPIPIPVDPAPWGGGGGWVGSIPRWPIPIPVDPAPWGGSFGSVPIRPPIGTIGDPPPFDLSNLNLSQLESSLHTINAEKTRLESLEKLVKDQIANRKQSK